MRKLDKPNDNAGDVYQTCIDIVKNKSLKARLRSIKPDIEAAAVAYDTAASAVSLFMLPQVDNVGRVSKAEMSDIYEYRMVKQGTPGRLIYDRLLAAPLHGRCPLCGQRLVSTLDHYLPRVSYPTLAVMPVNLIPACADCNKIKHHFTPATANEQTLHPYYDDVENDLWLRAEVLEQSPAAIRYFVVTPHGWNATKAARVRKHFSLFKLASLYSSYAASEIVDVRHLLDKLFAKSGAVAVRNHLQDQADTCSRAHINSWRTAMFAALASSNWFCSGGFR